MRIYVLPRVGTIDRLFFVHWNRAVTRADQRFVIEAMVEARRLVGAPLILIGILPPDWKLPDLEVRLEAIRLIPRVERLCQSQYAALLGDGIKNAILRGGLVVLAALMRNPVRIVGSVDEAL